VEVKTKNIYTYAKVITILTIRISIAAKECEDLIIPLTIMGHMAVMVS
jgi:hypothetical protein